MPSLPNDKFNIAWTYGMNNEEKKEFESLLSSHIGNRVLKRLKEVCQEKMNANERAENSLTQYDNPNWANKQAHFNGQRQALVLIQGLLEKF